MSLPDLKKVSPADIQAACNAAIVAHAEHLKSSGKMAAMPAAINPFFAALLQQILTNLPSLLAFLIPLLNPTPAPAPTPPAK